MAFHALEDLNEFFDFDQLDNDHGAQTSDGQHGQQFGHVGHFEDVMAIDWAAGETLPQPVLDDDFHQDSCMYNGFDDYQVVGGLQWPLTDIPLHLMTSRDAGEGSDLDSAGHVSKAESAIPGEQLSSIDTPYSSSPRSNTEHIASGDHHFSLSSSSDLVAARHTNLPTLDLPKVIATAPTTLDVPSTSRIGPSASSRLGTTPSWKPASAKRKGPQSRIPLEARQILEDEFTANPYPCSWEMDIIAHQANLEVKKVKNWFNNTRARKKVEGKSLASS
jgi:hypothetical protein